MMQHIIEKDLESELDGEDSQQERLRKVDRDELTARALTYAAGGHGARLAIRESLVEAKRNDGAETGGPAPADAKELVDEKDETTEKTPDA